MNKIYFSNYKLSAIFVFISVFILLNPIFLADTLVDDWVEPRGQATPTAYTPPVQQPTNYAPVDNTPVNNYSSDHKTPIFSQGFIIFFVVIALIAIAVWLILKNHKKSPEKQPIKKSNIITYLLIVFSAVLLAVIILILLVGMGSSSRRAGSMENASSQLTTYDGGYVPTAPNYSGSSGGATGSYGSTVDSSPTDATLGYSVGGAKDIDNFRENIKNNYLPLPSDLTYEGLFYDYYFDTGVKETCEELFCPAYSYAITKDPISDKDDYYLAVGLNSGLKESDFERKKLNLVIVLDVSGSMASTFNSYYYGSSVDTNENTEDSQKSKMQIANESLVALLDHLNPDDRFGMVLFDQQSYIVKPLNKIGQTDMENIKKHILNITPMGTTNMESGLRNATTMLQQYSNSNTSDYENRIIFLTDAMPNMGNTNEENLLFMTKDNADNKIYTTFIGIGLDFQTELIEEITKVKGANYYSVKSSKDFKKRMDDEFEYMVTPLVFDLVLRLDSQGFDIEKVYGSPDADQATGEIMRINTLFPSPTTEEGTKGGIIILKLKKTASQAQLKLSTSYQDRQNQIKSNIANISIPDKSSNYYENNGLRKAILLSRYADLMKNWLNDTGKDRDTTIRVYPAVNEETGIVIPGGFIYSQWERQSVPLTVSTEYKDLFKDFKTYFEKEQLAIDDDTLSQEITILNKLINN